MGYHFVFTESAKVDLDRLDAHIKHRLGTRLREYETSSTLIAHAKKLTDHASAQYRLRIGDYRLLMDKTENTFIVLRVRHRKYSYR